MYNLFLQKHFQLNFKMRHKNVMQVIMNTHTWRKAQQRTDKLCAVTVSINIYT